MADTKIKDIEYVKGVFLLEGYILLTTEYENQTQKLEYICPNGHKRHTTWKNWKKGNRCLICKNQSTRLSIDEIKPVFEKEGYTLISTEYINNKTKLDYICPEGHKNSITWADWNSGGYRCPDCANNKTLSIDKVIEDFKKEGYIFISGTYANNTSELVVKCPKGHEYETSRVKWTTGNRCPICYNKRVNIDLIRKSFEKEGYQLISGAYKDAHTKLKYICDKGHKHQISWSAWSQGQRCYRCSKAGTSSQEQEVLEYIKELKVKVITHNRSFIPPQEIDIIVPNKKLAIEYCGLYWHSELLGKDRKYHINKLKKCNDVEYNLITIFEDEWVDKKEIVQSRLKNILGVQRDVKTIYARKCVIKEISTSEAINFCEQNHLQGYTGSSIKLGAFHEDILVSVMTFAKPSLSKGQKGNKEGVWELSRFCNRINHRVPGIASKLLSYFKRNYVWGQVFSYADCRWSNGNLYEQIGFDYVGDTKPNYWYFKNGDLNRIHRFALRKKPDEPKDTTEWELRKAQGWNRIWDCGSKKYIMCID